MRRLIPLAAPIPALAVGAMIMRHHGIAPRLWGLNLAVGAAALLISAAVLTRAPGERRRGHSIIIALIGLGLLAMTFVDSGLSGVHRWVHLGPITLYAGAVALPLMIIAMNDRWATIIAVASAAILVAQPDAAQASALAVAVIVLTLHRSPREPIAWLGVLIVAALALWSWFRPDPLEPVPHVEGILGLARQAGVVWLALAIASLALLPVPFFASRDGANTPTTRALGAYLVVCILVPLVRPYPVPLLGFGVSPIIGYFVALVQGQRIAKSRPGSSNDPHGA